MKSSADPIAQIVKANDARLRDARYRAPGSDVDHGKVGPRSHPERYSLEGAGEALGLTGYDPAKHKLEPHDTPEARELKLEAGAHGKKEFYEMIEVLNKYEGMSNAGVALRTSTSAVEDQVKKGEARPQLGSDGDWKAVFFSALKTLLRETLYTRDAKQREEHLKQVYRWFKEKNDQFKRVDENGRSGKADASMPRSSLRGFGASRATRSASQSASVSVAGNEMAIEDIKSLLSTGEGGMSEEGSLQPAPQERTMQQPGAGAISTLTVDGELSRYRTRDLTSSYKKRLAAHGLVPASDTPQWKLPSAELERITNASKAVYGDPSTWPATHGPASGDDQPDFHARHAWTDPKFEELSADEQRQIAPPRPMQPDTERPKTARTHERIPGAELVDQNVPVRQARPHTAAPPSKDGAKAAAAGWRAEHNFTFYTPSDDPKELAMHNNFKERQTERLKKHQREVEMRSALTGWAVRRARIEEEIVRRQEAVHWSVRAHSAPPKQRILDVNAEDEDDGILSDESDTEFAADVAPVSGSQRPKSPSRGATWLSSYHEKSFHRIEYTKPKPEPRRPPSHRPMYVQRPESAATDVGGRPGSAFLTKESGKPKSAVAEAEDESTDLQSTTARTPRIISAEENLNRSMSNLPTKPRPMSATEYRKLLVERNKELGGKTGLAPPDDPKAPSLLKSLQPPADPAWGKDQMDFRVAQCAEVQGVREAFLRQGQRVSMATIERALSVPNERTFAECMASLKTSGQGLPSDPSMKKKKKGKKKKKKKK